MESKTLLPTGRIDLRRNPKTEGWYRSYIAYRKTGKISNTLLGTYKTGEFKGQEFLVLEQGAPFNPVMNDRYSHFLYSTNEALGFKKKQIKPASPKKALITGLNFDPLFPGKSYGDGGIYGDNKNDAFLFEFDDCMEKLSIWIFEGQKNQRRNLFQKWVSGNLDMAVKDMVLKVKEPSAYNKSTPGTNFVQKPRFR